MKKVTVKSLKFSKETISSFDKANIKGGTLGSGACTSSMNNHECYFQCDTCAGDGC